LAFLSDQNSDILKISVADPLHCGADLDPAFNFNADPDPAFYFDADLDPTFHFDTDPAPRQSDANLRSVV
jgi:hypothetical protein